MTEATFRPLDSLQVMAHIIKRCYEKEITINLNF